MEGNQDNTRRGWDFVLKLIGLITIIPLAPLINRFIPPIIIGYWNVDLLLSILLSFLLVRLMLWLFKPLIVPAFLLVSAVVLYNQFTDGYNLKSMLQDYRNMVVNNWNSKDKKEEDLYIVKPSIFDSGVERAAKGLKSKMNPKDSIVRNFAVRHSVEYFDEYQPKYGHLVRYLSLFKHINSNFKYVADPLRDEYYASPRETIEDGLAGDCDDHTILMISALKAIGARCRMVLTVGHVYPELYCGDKESFTRFQDAVTNLFANQNFKGLFYREENGNYWINLDYTARHPGGPYVDDKAYVVMEL